MIEFITANYKSMIIFKQDGIKRNLSEGQVTNTFYALTRGNNRIGTIFVHSPSTTYYVIEDAPPTTTKECIIKRGYKDLDVVGIFSVPADYDINQIPSKI